MNHHYLKIKKEHYSNVVSGTKTFEIRVNDRAFQKGDLLTMSEVDHIGVYTASEKINFKIGDVYPIYSERVVFSLLKVTNG